MTPMFMPKSKIGPPIVLVVTLFVTIGELISAGHIVAQTTAYTVSELSAAIDTSKVPCRLNNLGDLAGGTDRSLAGGIRATMWSRSTLKAKQLGALIGGDYSFASAINDAGEVAGSSNTGTAIVPFIWTPTGGFERVPLLPGDTCGQAFSINKHGHVVGYSSSLDGARAFLWTRSTGVRNLGSLPGGNYSRARAVNGSDVVVGTSASPDGNRAVLWTTNGTVRDLGTLPGDTSSEAVAINNAGNVVGYSKGPRGRHAFLWTGATGMQDLGVLAGGKSSRALDINDLGYVVGSSSGSSDDHAFIWTKEAGLKDLNTAASAALGLVFIEAQSINYNGEIVVTGKKIDLNSGEHQLCSPAPPATFLLKPTTTP